MKTRETQFSFTLVLLLSLFLLMVGMWTTDAGASALITGNTTFGIFGDVPPTFTYHLGLVLITISALMMCAESAYLIIYWRKPDEK